MSRRGLRRVAPRALWALAAAALVLPDAGCDSNARGPVAKAPPHWGPGEGGDGNPGSGNPTGGNAAGGSAGEDEPGASSSGGAVELPPPEEPPPSTPCNGNDGYCSLRYDETCFAATHDSAANSAKFWQHPAQDQAVREQLNYGVRALMLSIFDDGGVATVCRGSCDEGNVPLSVVLGDVATFFDENPREVLTLLLDGELPAERLADELRAAYLDGLALPQTAEDAWPTLEEMIESGQRLVVFAATPDAGPAWLLDRQAFIWETAKDWPSVSRMNCNPAIGDVSRPLYLVHHNLVGGDGEESGGMGGGGGQPSETVDAPLALAAEANEFSVVTERLQYCETQHRHVPSFVAVDFSRVGDAQGATQVMNRVRAP